MAPGDLYSRPVAPLRLRPGRAGLVSAALLLLVAVAPGCSRDAAPSGDSGKNAQVSSAERSPAFRNLGKRAESQL